MYNRGKRYHINDIDFILSIMRLTISITHKYLDNYDSHKYTNMYY